MPRTAHDRLPAYALYGEADRQPAGDPLHCESIAARSRLHDWEIRPHRHASLFQVLVVRRGRTEVTMDGRQQVLAGPALVTVPPLVAHGFRFAPPVDGWVFTLVDGHWRALLAGAPGLAAALDRPHAWRPAAGAERREVLAAADALRAQVAGHGAWRAAAIDAALLRLLVAVARALPPTPAAAGDAPARALAHVQRFRERVEARFREQPSLAALAGELGITPTQLNRVCRRVAGRGALDLLHERLVLEAQRDLAYTTMSVKQVALGLGFADAAYFTRFFRRRLGMTPTEWRASRQAAPRRN